MQTVFTPAGKVAGFILNRGRYFEAFTAGHESKMLWISAKHPIERLQIVEHALWVSTTCADPKQGLG
jgi:hypothetical protein